MTKSATPKVLSDTHRKTAPKVAAQKARLTTVRLLLKLPSKSRVIQPQARSQVVAGRVIASSNSLLTNVSTKKAPAYEPIQGSCAKLYASPSSPARAPATLLFFNPLGQS
jgi:hypothetical protein